MSQREPLLPSLSMTTLFSYAFRPFFLLVGGAAVVLIAGWGLHLANLRVWPDPLSAKLIHGHEMLLGYAGGAIAGFLLTAVATWTGRPPVSGRLLMALCAAWIAARLGAWLPGSLGGVVWGLGSLLFWAGLLGVMAREVLGARNTRNYKVLALLLALLVLEAIFFGTPGNPWVQEACLRAGLFLVLGMISVVGGRIIPAFTQNWLRLKRPEIQARLPGFNRLDLAVVLITSVFAIGFVLWPLAAVTGWLGLIAGFAQAVRLARWQGWLAAREPLLWILHVGYAWTPLGFLLLGLGILGEPPVLDRGLHALAYGAIGTLILGVAARVALGHTGRPLQSFPAITLAFVLISLGTLCRLLAPAMGALLGLSVALWVLAYALFLLQYAPILLRPGLKNAV
jgi:uncharacterized protein involved in response to NO